MNPIIRKAVPVIVSMLCCLPAFPGALAYNDRTASNYQQTYHPPVYQPQPITFHDYISTHPKMRSATIGAGVGTAAGAVTGLLTGRGVLRGAVIGAGAGAGTGLLRSSYTMQRHPIVNNIATGTMVGLGLGLAGGRFQGTTARTAGVGAATGLATGLLVHGL
ncbi:MAG: hypothetical protein JST01_17170 [Cyanobacteria bacterium SZAS TMP-1]|nr:hypothetical protein [Cyanobacteria bacterium SZAS TMP-1]